MVTKSHADVNEATFGLFYIIVETPRLWEYKRLQHSSFKLIWWCACKPK